MEPLEPSALLAKCITLKRGQVVSVTWREKGKSRWREWTMKVTKEVISTTRQKDLGQWKKEGDNTTYYFPADDLEYGDVEPEGKGMTPVKTPTPAKPKAIINLDSSDGEDDPDASSDDDPAERELTLADVKEPEHWHKTVKNISHWSDARRLLDEEYGDLGATQPEKHLITAIRDIYLKLIKLSSKMPSDVTQSPEFQEVASTALCALFIQKERKALNITRPQHPKENGIDLDNLARGFMARTTLTKREIQARSFARSSDRREKLPPQK